MQRQKRRAYFVRMPVLPCEHGAALRLVFFPNANLALDETEAGRGRLSRADEDADGVVQAA